MAPTSLSPIQRICMSLWICSIWIGALSLPLATAQPGLTFPYVAYVSVSDANIHSGPGQRHYPTATLPVGLAVQVYRHDSEDLRQPQSGHNPKQVPDPKQEESSHSENTWCAIRPPEGSISWIDSLQVRKLPGGTAEILGSRTLVRVGSQLSAKQNAVQVALSQGELVKLATDDVSANGQWLAIEPPAGEFRWILASQLSRQPPQESQGIRNNVPQRQSLWKSRQEARATRQRTQQSTTITSHSVISSSMQPHAIDTASAHNSRGTIDEPIHIITGSPADLMLVQSQQAPSSGPLSHLASSTTNPLNSVSGGLQRTPPPRIHFGDLTTSLSNQAGQFSDQKAPGRSRQGSPITNSSQITPPAQNHFDRLSELQVRLSLMVVQDPGQWQFEQLLQEANILLNQADSSAFRDKTRDFLDQITLFERVRAGRIEPTIFPTKGSQSETLLAGHGESAENTETTGNLSAPHQRRQLDMRQRVLADLSAGQLGSDSTGKQNAARKETSDTVRYDAVGLLKPVISRRDRSPRYALVDDDGKVISFVTPTTDVNLRPYIGRRIGVNGTRGFMPEYRRAHVTASRITPIMR